MSDPEAALYPTAKSQTESEVGGGEVTAEESPPAARVTDETDYFQFADKPEVAHSFIDGRPLDNISRIPI
jgi:hypothetical protein